MHRENVSANKLNGKEIIKRSASTSSKTTDLHRNSSCINKKLLKEKPIRLVGINESLTERNRKLHDNNDMAYPKEVEKEKVLEVRNKLNDYYVEQINSKLSNINNSSKNTENKLNRAINYNKIQSGINSSIDVQKDSVNKLLELGKDVKNKNAPVKLLDKNNSKQYNTIQAISIKPISQYRIEDDDIYPSVPTGSGVIMNKRREDLNILKSFAENVSVNQGGVKFIKKNISYDMDVPNYSTISPSIYNKKNIHRNQQEVKHEINSQYKLDKLSKEFLINKMSTLNSELEYNKKNNIK
jgi:hypothetical protein